MLSNNADAEISLSKIFLSTTEIPTGHKSHLIDKKLVLKVIKYFWTEY